MATTTDKIVKHQTCKLTLQHQVFIDILTFLSKKLLTEIKPYESCEKVPENIEKVPGDFTSDNRPFIADLQWELFDIFDKLWCNITCQKNTCFFLNISFWLL